MRFLILTLLSLLLISCPESTNPDKIFSRYIYFSVTEEDGASEGEAGFYCFSTHDLSLKQLSFVSSPANTIVARNGVIVFQRPEESAKRLVGRCEDGNLVEVPIPQPEPLSINYSLSIPPQPALAFEGHHLAYAMNMTTLVVTDIISPLLIIYNCSFDDTTIVVINDILEEEESKDYGSIRWAGGNLKISNDGSVVWGVLEAFDDSGISLGFRVFEWNNGKLEWLGEISENNMLLLGVEFLTQTLWFERNGKIEMLNKHGAFLSSSITTNNLNSKYQFACEFKEMAVWTENGIALYDYGENTPISEVISFQKINSKSRIHPGEPTHLLNFSADSKVIVYGLKVPGEDTYDLMIVNRDGTGFKTIKQGIAARDIVISSEFEVKD